MTPRIKLTEQLQAAICAAVGAGMDPTIAALNSDMLPDTFESWTSGEVPGTEEFIAMLQRATNDAALHAHLVAARAGKRQAPPAEPTPELAERLAKALLDGVWIWISGLREGVPVETLQAWLMTPGSFRDTVLDAFNHARFMARARYEVRRRSENGSLSSSEPGGGGL
jgi:hypothetical protein